MATPSITNLPDLDFLPAALFRFCRQGLTALPVFFLFMACDQLLPPPAGGTGKRVEPIIRSVRVIDYNEASGTRSAAGEQKGIVGEPIVQDLGDGMFAEITVEEDVSALRATGYLADGVVFRAIAVDSDDKVYSWADYRANATDKTMDRYNGNLHVVEGETYYYVYISYNNKTTLPDPPNIGDNIATVIDITAGSNDLMWWKTDPPAQVNGVPELKFDFGQKLIRATLKLNAGTGKTIKAVADNAFSLDAPDSGKFNLKTGNLSNGSGSTIFSWPETINDETVTSGTFTFLPKESGDYILSWPAEAVTVMENSTQKKTVAGNTTILNSKLKAGSRYTIALKFNRLPRFAGSNIYWDSDNSRLTFEPYGTNANTKYQGVYFKWGSLIGVAAGAGGEAYNNNTTTGTILYRSTNTSATPGTARAWEKLTGGYTWDNIPYYNTSVTSNNTQRTLLNNPDFTNHKGDICNYIDKNYRMPTGLELDSLKSYHKAFEGKDITVSKTDGTYEVTTQYATFAGLVFPASGDRGISSGGTLTDVGSIGHYWSGSANSGSGSAYSLYFNSSGVADANGDNRGRGFPVRCVKN